MKTRIAIMLLAGTAAAALLLALAGVAWAADGAPAAKVSVVGWTLAAFAAVWANRARYWGLVAQAMRRAEKDGPATGLEGEALNEWLETRCLAYIRERGWCRWAPDWLLVGVISRIAGDQQK